jgi:nickel-dependent lactate racemase
MPPAAAVYRCRVPRFRVPYARGELEFEAPPWADVDVLESRRVSGLGDVVGAVRDAIARPLGSPPLRELAAEAVARAGRRQARAVIAVTDVTRASPDHLLVPPMLEELRAGGLRDSDIAICVAVGIHRPSTDAEKRAKLGREVVARHEVFDSDGRDPGKWADLGTVPPYGVQALVQRRIVEADLVLATGVVEPHQYAGYSGGRKTVAIGCCGEPVITATHGLRFLEDPGVRLGRLEGNPFHETVREIARRAGLRFCVNVVNNDAEEVFAVAAGDPDAVLARLAERAAEVYVRPIAKQYDVAIGGVGYPKDSNLYQASRAATYLRFAPVPAVRAGGVIIVPARCEEGAGTGAGEQRFLAALESAPSPEAVVEHARRAFAGGEQRAIMVALTLQHCAIVIVAAEHPDVVRRAKLRHAPDLASALAFAHDHLGAPARASVLLVPRAMHTLPQASRAVAGHA